MISQYREYLGCICGEGQWSNLNLLNPIYGGLSHVGDNINSQLTDRKILWKSWIPTFPCFYQWPGSANNSSCFPRPWIDSEAAALDAYFCSRHKCSALAFDPRMTFASLLTPHSPARVGSFKLINGGGGLGAFPHFLQASQCLFKFNRIHLWNSVFLLSFATKGFPLLLGG